VAGGGGEVATDTRYLIIVGDLIPLVCELVTTYFDHLFAIADRATIKNVGQRTVTAETFSVLVVI